MYNIKNRFNTCGTTIIKHGLNKKKWKKHLSLEEPKL